MTNNRIAVYRITSFIPNYYHVYIIDDHGVIDGSFCETWEAMIDFIRQYGVTKIRKKEG